MRHLPLLFVLPLLLCLAGCPADQGGDHGHDHGEDGHAHGEGGHDHGEGGHDTEGSNGVLARFVQADTQDKVGYLRLKLHDDKGDLELWLAKDAEMKVQAERAALRQEMASANRDNQQLLPLLVNHIRLLSTSNLRGTAMPTPMSEQVLSLIQQQLS